MSSDSELDYYRRREAGARQMAASCRDEAIRRIHTDMADRYAARVRDMTQRPVLRLF